MVSVRENSEVPLTEEKPETVQESKIVEEPKFADGIRTPRLVSSGRRYCSLNIGVLTSVCILIECTGHQIYKCVCEFYLSKFLIY